MKNTSNWEGFDIVFCSHCNKDGQSPEALEGFNACIKCGGFGFIVNERTDLQEETEVDTAKQTGVRFASG